MITTTLRKILAAGPCGQEPGYDGELTGWLKLLNGLGKDGPDDEPLSYADILRINGLNDALWACRCEPQYERACRLYVVTAARGIQHLMAEARSIAALDELERRVCVLAMEDELAAAWSASADAATAAWAVGWKCVGDCGAGGTVLRGGVVSASPSSAPALPAD